VLHPGSLRKSISSIAQRVVHNDLTNLSAESDANLCRAANVDACSDARAWILQGRLVEIFDEVLFPYLTT
jgi:hypothetical protein